MITGLPAAISVSRSAKRGASWYETSPWHRRAARIALPEPPHRGDDQDDQQYRTRRAAGACGQAVDAAGELLHFLVRHGGDALVGVRRIDAERLQLVGDVRAAEEVQHGRAVSL